MKCLNIKLILQLVLALSLFTSVSYSQNITVSELKEANNDLADGARCLQSEQFRQRQANEQDSIIAALQAQLKAATQQLNTYAANEKKLVAQNDIYYKMATNIETRLEAEKRKNWSFGPSIGWGVTGANSTAFMVGFSIQSMFFKF